MIPHYELRTRFEGEQAMVWDQIRKKWLVWQPEEIVRQQLICFLVQEKNISASLIGVEKEIIYNDQRKRFDLIVFNREAKPFIVIECKAPEVPISKKALEQVARYNTILDAPHLLLFNGHQWAFLSKNSEGIFQLQPKGWFE
ncbi:MAG: type I restriction enzyme HsdR N-terminal domain-containing protein [Bacteroidia bacterium]|nr:type I restriction enzyme HsdR N-terminal domain-containing protein [Bacteroidia bacterium]